MADTADLEHGRFLYALSNLDLTHRRSGADADDRVEVRSAEAGCSIRVTSST